MSRKDELRRIKREERAGRKVKAAEVLSEIAAFHLLDMEVLRRRHPGRPPQVVTEVRREFIHRMQRFVSFDTIADLLFCNVSTVQFHTSEKYRNKTRVLNDRYQARLRAASREDRGLDRTVPPG